VNDEIDAFAVSAAGIDVRLPFARHSGGPYKL